jgi:hypothetical protein
MVFDSYIDFYNHLKTFPFKDIIFGVSDTIEEDTLYISVLDSKVIRMDNTSFVMGYTYSLVLSVKSVDSPLVGAVANLSQDGLNFVNWSEQSHMYNYQTSVYLPVGKGGEPWQALKK